MALTNQPTPITGITSIDYVGSPHHLHLTSTQLFDSVKVLLWIWSGPLDTVYSAATNPTFTIEKNLVSVNDSAIVIELGDYIKPLIQPRLDFNYGVNAYDECLYYQYEVYFYKDKVLVDTQLPKTRLATLGYNWYWEGEHTYDNNGGSFGYYDETPNKYYYNYLRYFTPGINLSGVTSSFDMVVREPYIPKPHELRCTELPALIIYLNKQGLFEAFSITGNINIATNTTRESFQRGTRNPLGTDRNQFHTTQNYNIQSRDRYVVNTGLLTEDMGQLVEEIIHSTQVYLVLFKGPLQPSETLTVDSTVITVDNTVITVDAVGFGGTETIYRQVPVTVTSSEFLRRTKLNDKANIAYTLELTAANNKKNTIRG